MAKRLGNPARDAPRLLRAVCTNSGRHAADGENAVLVHVLDRIVELHAAILPAHHDDGDLPLESNKTLDEGRLSAELFERRDRLFLSADQRLPLAVIAEAPRLQDA